jgi:hypothetical protein
MADQEINNRILFLKLEEIGISRIEIPFDGAGDSGSIETMEIRLLDSLGNIVVEPDTDDNFIELLVDFAYEYLEKFYDYDWYNNEGGYGTININLEEKEIDVEGWQRVSTVEDAHDSQDLLHVLDTIN